MPVRNGSNTVGPAIRSTLKAMSVNDELLVMDDASTDETRDVIRDFGDSRIRIMYNSEGQGVAGSLNSLLDGASRPTVARMDADDLMLPWRLRVQKLSLDFGLDAVFSTRLNFGSSVKNFKPQVQDRIMPREAPIMFAVFNPVAHSSMMMRRDVLQSLGGYVTGPAEDYDLWMRLLGAGHCLGQTRRPGILYRLHADQVTKGKNWLRSYRVNEGLKNAHDSLMLQMGWQGGSCWHLVSELESPRNTPATAMATPFARFVTNKLAELSPLNRLIVRRRLGRLLSPQPHNRDR
ncbi:glycosyltransferase family A protein [Kocuria rosea]|nr:glycosyltransferase family A protein [Kocuria rosea]WIG19085.1 glycosyltransferase family A protein [Kocuria rosea]